MLEKCKKKFADKNFITYVNSDTIDFLLSTETTYDFAYSLWSFSHSVHQNLAKLGMEEGKKKVREGIAKLLTENLKLGGSFFLVHFDLLSDEQKISIKQRKRDNSVYQGDGGTQSPSKLIIDELLKELKETGKIDFTDKHYVGKPIEFLTLDSALEYYLNFHMESHFNTSENLEEILTEIIEDLKPYTGHDGVIRISPGCFIYQIFRRFHTDPVSALSGIGKDIWQSLGGTEKYIKSERSVW